MADESRALYDPSGEIAALRSRMDAMESQSAAWQHRSSTGTFELGLRTTAKPGTLICDGSAVSRIDYIDLFNWATEQGHIGGLFGNGDGATTFNVPDLRGMFPAFAGAGGITPGGTGGQASRALTVAELPVHGHTATTTVTVQQHAGHDHSFSGSGTAGSAGSHDHAGSAASVGGHGGHSSGSTNVTQSGSGVTLPGNYNASGGGHGHSVDISAGGSHAHSVSLSGDVGTSAALTHTATGATTVNNAGSGAAFDQRPPFIGFLPLVWT